MFFCCCTPASCDWSVEVTGCNGMALAGASVSVSQAGAPKGAAATDAGGLAAFTLPAGVYDVAVASRGFTTATFAAVTMTCLATQTLAMADRVDPLYVCTCLSFPVKRLLTLTDPAGTHAMSYDSTIPAWAASYSAGPVSLLTCAGANGPPGPCSPCCSDAGAGSAPVLVYLTCGAGGFNLGYKSYGAAAPVFGCLAGCGHHYTATCQNCTSGQGAQTITPAHPNGDAAAPASSPLNLSFAVGGWTISFGSPMPQELVSGTATVTE